MRVPAEGGYAERGFAVGVCGVDWGAGCEEKLEGGEEAAGSDLYDGAGRVGREMGGRLGSYLGMGVGGGAAGAGRSP